MSLKNSSVDFRICLISWPVGFETPTDHSHVYLNMGEIYDKEVRMSVNKLMTLHNKLKYLYPFKIKKVDNDITVYNSDDFKYFSKKYKITTKVSLYNYNSVNENNTEHIVFKSPQLYNISCMEPLFSPYIPPLLQQNKESYNDYRVFIVLPYENPVLRGMILDSCITKIKEKKPLFILLGDRYGKNKESTSTLMKRYLLSIGICSNSINKILCNKFPDFISESLHLLSFILHIDKNISYDIFIASKSSDMFKIMSYVRDTKISQDVNVQYICE